MSFEIASYEGRPALVIRSYDQEHEDGSTTAVADVRVFSDNPIDSDQFLSGVELDAADDDAADPEPPTEPAKLGSLQA